ncbi:MAG: hypothetical protein HYR58_07550, partial [Acidobacteria bacterium]|nr:hypothetical protein [Acidobacteriota bacterium]
MESSSIYDSLADLLVYPGDGYHQRVTRAARALAAVDGEAALLLAHVAEQIRNFSVEALQELFIQTFDMNP